MRYPIRIKSVQQNRLRSASVFWQTQSVNQPLCDLCTLTQGSRSSLWWLVICDHNYVVRTSLISQDSSMCCGSDALQRGSVLVEEVLFVSVRIVRSCAGRQVFWCPNKADRGLAEGMKVVMSSGEQQSLLRHTPRRADVSVLMFSAVWVYKPVTMSSGGSVAAVKRLEALFRNVRLETQPSDHIHMQTKFETKGCDVHGNGNHKINGYGSRRGSLGSILHNRRESVGPRRESMPALNSSVAHRRRDSLGLPHSPPRKDCLVHPSAFPSTLRRDSLGSSMGSLRKDSLNVPLRRDSMGSTGSLRKDSVGPRKDSLGSVSSGRKDSCTSRRRFSTDSLDAVHRNSWDPGRRGSSSSSGGWDDPIWEENIINKVMFAKSFYGSLVIVLASHYLFYLWFNDAVTSSDSSA